MQPVVEMIQQYNYTTLKITNNINYCHCHSLKTYTHADAHTQ